MVEFGGSDGGGVVVVVVGSGVTVAIPISLTAVQGLVVAEEVVVWKVLVVILVLDKGNTNGVAVDGDGRDDDDDVAAVAC
jgi:hypothetical protein